MADKKNPLISIIIPTFNREIELKHAIDSVLNQTYENWELIIVDNNSSDGTDELIKIYNDNRFKLFKINNDGVIAASRNKGIQVSNGEYLAFLDSDDWWLPNKLEKCISLIIDSKDKIDFVYHSLYVSSQRKNIQTFKKIFARQLMSPIYEDLILNNNPIATSSVLVSAELIKICEGFSEDKNLIAAEDYDCWLRISRLSDKFQSIEEPLGYWFDGGNTSSPELTLKYLDSLRKIHIDQFILEKRKEMPNWWSYHKGRSLFLINDYKEAKKYLKKVLLRNPGLSVKIKSLYMLIKIYLLK